MPLLRGVSLLTLVLGAEVGKGLRVSLYVVFPWPQRSVGLHAATQPLSGVVSSAGLGGTQKKTRNSIHLQFRHFRLGGSVSSAQRHLL